jgi:ABC-type multidrug transport system ATPase subunit
VDSNVEVGKAFALPGPFGPGKTTLIRILTTQPKPTAERISSEPKEYRDRQTRDGVIMTLAGGALLVMGFMLTFF